MWTRRRTAPGLEIVLWLLGFYIKIYLFAITNGKIAPKNMVN
jgi:hypothetical protein